MKNKCVCGKEVDERINYCVHCGKELVKCEETKKSCTRKKKSTKYSPMLEILKG